MTHPFLCDLLLISRGTKYGSSRTSGRGGVAEGVGGGWSCYAGDAKGCGDRGSKWGGMPTDRWNDTAHACCHMLHRLFLSAIIAYTSWLLLQDVKDGEGD